LLIKQIFCSCISYKFGT